MLAWSCGTLEKLGPLGDGDGFHGASLWFRQKEAHGKVLQKGIVGQRLTGNGEGSSG